MYSFCFYITECDFETEPDVEVSGLQEPLMHWYVVRWKWF